MWVDESRWDELGHTVAAESDVPLGVMNDPVMSGAQEHAFVDVGVAAIGPRIDVVGFAPPGRSVASGECTATIAVGEGDALGFVVEATLAANSQDAG